MKTITQLKKLLIIPLLLLVGNVCLGQYKLPFIPNTSVSVSRNGHGPCTAHCTSNSNNQTCYSYNSIDFIGVVNTVVAAKGGCVRAVKENSNVGGNNQSFSNDANYVIINHGDGTEALYLHLAYNSVLVQVGDNVTQGQPIATMGNTGYSTATHLHFQIQNASPCGQATDWWKPSLPVAFEEVTTDAGVPSSCTDPYISLNAGVNEINQSLPIYAGSITTPKEFKLVIEDPQFSFNVNQISEIKITSSAGVIKNILNPAITQEQFSVSNPSGSQNSFKDWRLIKFTPTSSQLNGFTNSRGYKISFKLTQGSSVKTYQNNDLYFEDFYSPTSLQDLSDLDNWVAGAVRVGANMGLYRGPSDTQFNPSENLTRAQAATVLVNLATRLRLLNVVTTGSQFSDVSSTHPFFKYIQTLKNYGYITSNTNFNPDSFITVGEFCKMITNVLNIQPSDYAPTPYLNYLGRKIIVSSTNTELADAMNKLLKIVDVTDTNGFWITNNAWDFFDFSSISQTSNFYTVTGTSYVSRAKMAKVLLNLANWKSTQTGVSLRTNNAIFSTNNLSDGVSLGEKYDNASITATSTPVTPTQQTYSVNSGGSITILYNPGSLPQHYYWSMQKNGATLTSNNAAHSSVTFTAPSVATPTQWKLYTYTANNKGKARETFITISVSGSSGGNSSAPTTQAHSLSLYGATSTSLTASWTRGSGQNCLVTCYEVGANTQDVPDAGVIYNGNTNFTSAPPIFNGSDTKIVYTGTSSNCTITGLIPNRQYQVTVFEYNGTTPSNVLYNLSNPPVSVKTTLQSVITTPSANFSWDETLTFQTGQSFIFTNSSTNANTYQWSITPSENISNTTSATTTNVTIANSGQHTLTLIATNTSTGETSTRSHNFYVYNATELLADLQPTNLNFTSPMIGGQNLTITCNVQNNSTASQSYTTHITFVLSLDQVIDISDQFLGQQSYTIGAGESVSISHTATNILNTFSGNYYILAKADYWDSIPNGYVPESNETNNTISKAIVLTAALPDFVALSLTPSLINVNSGQEFSVSGTFRNIGLGNAQYNSVLADFYISTDNILSADDRKINGTFFLNNNIIYGNSNIISANGNIRLPLDLENGNYFIFTAVDYTRSNTPNLEYNFNIELNENNNFVSAPITVANPNQPIVNASNFSISNITSNSLTLNWTRGNGQNCIVLARADSDLPNFIVDGVSYTANANFNSAPGITGFYNSDDGSFSVDNYSYVKLLYDGTGTSVNISGLLPNETYSFIVLEYNGTGVNKDYLQKSNFKGISAHTKGQNLNDNFQRLIGTINPNATAQVYAPKGVKFFTENNGIIFRNDNGIAKTSDGGKSWIFNRHPIIEKNKGSMLKSSSWLENGFGWLVFENGNILKTTDFGVNWSEITLDRVIEDVHFPTQNTGYIALKSLTNVSNGNDGAIYKTTNSGSTWSNVGSFSRPISSIYFLNEQLGWATSYTPTSSFDKIFYKTTNGGNTWNQVVFSTSPSQSSILTDLYFVDENNGFAMGIYGWLFKTTNGGSTWSMHNIFNISSTINTYSKIDFVNSQVGYINLQNRKIAKTSDGGATWNVFEIQNDYASGSIAEIDALNENIVYVGGISGLLKSSTGGQSNTISLSNTNSSYCTTQTITVPYVITGIYNPSNTFLVQLSDATGSFLNPIVLSTFSNVGNGSLNVTLPSSLAAGNNYKIRVLANNPAITSNETSTFSITTGITSSVSATPSATTICPNTNVTFTATPTNGGLTPTYVWKRNGQIVGSNSNQYSASDLTNDDVVWVEMVSNQTCSSTIPVISQPVTVGVTQIDDVFIQAIDNILAASTDVGVQWIRNGQPIVGATSQFYEATQTGFYQFSVTVNGCIVLSDIYQLTSLGTDDTVFNSSNISVYPNPTNDLLNIKSLNNNMTEILLFDLQGKKVIEQKTTGETHQLNIENLPTAVYILQVQTDKGKELFKVIKK